MNKIRKADIEDADFIDAAELASSTGTTYLSGVTVASTVSATKRVNLSGVAILNADTPVESGDKATLTGPAAGTYTVDVVIDDVTFSVVESIADGGAGTASFKYPEGGSKVGFAATGTSLSSSRVADALRATYYDLLLEEDPDDVGVTYTPTYSLGQVTAEEWKSTATNLKLKTVAYTYTLGRVTSEVVKVYDPADGATVKAQVTTTYTYSGAQVSSAVTTRDV
jgi:hypothetical protein